MKGEASDLNLAIATNIAEIIASIGVVVSLIYIAREFRRGMRNASLERFSKAIETQVHQFAHLADEPEKAELVRQGLADLDQLDRGQQGQFSAIIHDILLSHDLVRRAYESGELPEKEFRIMQDLWVSIMRTNGGRQWWAGWRSIMPDDVVKYVDSALDDPNIKTGTLCEEVPWLFALEDKPVSSQGPEKNENYS